jgi:hypothetical protein
LFLAKYLLGRAAWHAVTETNKTKALDVLWEWGKQKLITEELSNNFLLAKEDKNTLGTWQE